MFNHFHPYTPYIPDAATKLIVGTLPPPRFTTGELKEGDVNFCYGSRDGQLWNILDRIFNLNLKYDASEEAKNQRKHFLNDRGIGICDMVASAKRDKIDATDLGIQDAELRDLMAVLGKYARVNTLLFTGGNSKNGPEYFFRKHLNNYQLKLKLVSADTPKIHSFTHPQDGRLIKTVSLTAPSGSANRAVGSMKLYKEMKAKNPHFTAIDFRVMQYRPFFQNESI